MHTLTWRKMEQQREQHHTAAQPASAQPPPPPPPPPQQQQYRAHAEQGLALTVAESHEAGHQLTEGDFGSLLQEQLARIRRSWNHKVQQPTAAPAFQDGATKRAEPPPELPPPSKQPRLAANRDAPVALPVRVEVVEMEQVDLAGSPKLPGAQNLTQGDAVGGSSVGVPGAVIYPEPARGFGTEHYSMTQRQHALHLARQRMQMTNSSTVQWEIIRALALALGAARMETGTFNALRAVLLQLDHQLSISDKEAYTPRREPACLTS